MSMAKAHAPARFARLCEGLCTEQLMRRDRDSTRTPIPTVGPAQLATAHDERSESTGLGMGPDR